MGKLIFLPQLTTKLVGKWGKNMHQLVIFK